MEHPGHVWNAIESRVNKYLGRILPAQVLRWLWVLVHGGLVFYGGLITLFIIVMTGALLSHITGASLQEQAVHAPADMVNPANDGKLVKICGRVSIPAPACDPLTGVRAHVIRLERISNRDECFYPHTLNVGAFTLVNYEEELRYGVDEVMPAPLQFGQPAQGYSFRPGDESQNFFELISTQSSERSRVRYLTYSEDTLYLVGRQVGNVLDFSDPKAAIFTFRPDNWENNNPRPHDGAGWKDFCLAVMMPFFAYLPLLFVLGSLRSGLWHATGGRDLLRLPLCEATLLLEAGSICLIYGLIRMNEPSPTPTLGLAAVILALGLLAHSLRRWHSLRPYP
ncbi:MAG: hypothetical protein IJO38_03440 [Akkermansia sp.]|nr:hypothetical protein [Akkermansia sp.]